MAIADIYTMPVTKLTAGLAMEQLAHSITTFGSYNVGDDFDEYVAMPQLQERFDLLDVAEATQLVHDILKAGKKPRVAREYRTTLCEILLERYPHKNQITDPIVVALVEA